MQCPACQQNMRKGCNTAGAVIDFCDSCQGMWFDKGEILYYSQAPHDLSSKLQQGLIDGKPSSRQCPRCYKSMEVGGLLQKDLEVDLCPKCEGIWLDSGELKQLQNLEGMAFLKKADKHLSPRKAQGTGALQELEASVLGEAQSGRASVLPPISIPNLGLRSLATMGILYGILYAIMVLASEVLELPPSISILTTAVILFIQYLIGPWILDFQLNMMFHITWPVTMDLPEHLTTFVDEVCKTHDISFPAFGIIEDETPNAFTYGRYPSDARIVITRGLMKKLSPEELRSVVAHEIGHAVNWDMALMTLAALVPIVLYQIFRWLTNIQRHLGNSKESGNLKAPLMLIALVAYIAHVISEYIVLFLSRTREYHADAFAAEAMKDSRSLSSALVKVAYGLASDGEKQSQEGEEQREATSGRLMAPLGIFDVTAAKALVCTTAMSGGGGGELNKTMVQDAMQWELWNPWAWFYELKSTHPLVANRLDCLSRLSFKYGHKPLLLFDRQQPESYWDEFLVDVLLIWLPYLTAPAFAAFVYSRGGHDSIWGWAICGFFLGQLIQTVMTYKGEFLPHTVASLLKQIKVSSIRNVPARLSGKIIGRGIPGYILSEDMTFQDKTGYIFVDYNQPLAFMEWWFAIAKNSMVGQEVIIEGYYKRAPVPYIELYRILDSSGNPLDTSYSYGFRIFLYTLLAILGGAWGWSVR